MVYFGHVIIHPIYLSIYQSISQLLVATVPASFLQQHHRGRRCTGSSRSPIRSQAVFLPLDWEVEERKVPVKLICMIDYESHPLQDVSFALGSSLSDRLIHPHCMKEWFHSSFFLLLTVSRDPSALNVQYAFTAVAMPTTCYNGNFQ